MFKLADGAGEPLIEIDASRVKEAADAIPRLHAGSLAGILVRGVFDLDEVAALVSALEEHGAELPMFKPPIFKGRVLGKPLVAAAEGITDYLDQAERFRAGCARIHAAYPDMEQRLHDAISALAGDYPTSVPRWADGRDFLAATIRILIEGDSLPLHYENETFSRPVMAKFSPLLDQTNMLSFYMPLVIPRSGGVLRLFHTSCLDGGDSLIEDLGGEEKALAHFEARGYSEVLPEIGDLLVFDGGRWYHDVTPIADGERWTLGGFLASTRDGNKVHYWS